MKHNSTRTEAILIKYRRLTRKLSFKRVHLVSSGDVYVLTVNALIQNTNRNRRATSVGAFDVYVAIFRARTREIPSGGHYSSKILSQDRSREYSKSMEYLEVNRLILKFWQSFYILYQICTT